MAKASIMGGEIVPRGASMGRPITYTDKIADEICVRISLGESLRSICLDDDMPPRRTVFEWLAREDEIGEAFRTKYARARELQADTNVDEMNDIADDGTNDWMERHDKDGAVIGYVLNGEHVTRSKLRIETRRWIAEKLRPKKYGNRLDVTTDGKALNDLDAVERAARVSSLLAEARLRKGDG